jgi:hypothetical protein
MWVRRTLGALVWASLALACGSARKGEGTPNATGGGGDGNATAGNGPAAGNAGVANPAGGGSPGGAGQSGTGTGGSSTGGTGQGGAAIIGVGNGELDTTCMMRTSNQIAGGRIVLRNAVTAEGDKAFIGFYDNVKKAECRVAQDAEGKFRCMPPALDKDLVNRFYLDDKCTSEVQYRGACALDYEAEPIASDSCDKRRRLYPFGDPLPDSMVFQPGQDGKCKPYGMLNNLYQRGPDVVPSDYAEVQPVVWRGKGRIWAQGYQGDGDLHLVSSFVDSQLNQNCTFSLLADGKEHCVPQSQGSLQSYTDATCKLPLIDIASTCGAPPAPYASYSMGDVCKPGLSFAEANVKYAGQLYGRSSCMPVATSAIAFTVKVVPDSDFLAVESTTLTTDPGRLKPMYRTALDGGCSFQDWWDDQLQTACSFESNYAGAPYYCLPIADPASSASYVEAFTDSGCITETPYVKMPNCNGAKPPKFLAVPEPTCVFGWRSIRPVVPTPAVLPALWNNATGTCLPYTADTGATYYATGAVMPNTMFVQATPEP